MELGQMAFGNKWETHHAPDFIANDLYALSETLGSRSPEAQAHGFLGGTWGYGQDFASDVFEMFPYWWGDCECGREDREVAWCDEHDHSADCYQTALSAAFVAAGLDADGFGPHDQKDRAAVRDRVYAEVCAAFGLPMTGCGVHCTCGHDAEYAAWSEANPHDDRCGEVRPNFHHFASGLRVHWYKYIGRSMTANMEIQRADWRRIISECEDSLSEGDGVQIE